LKFSDTPLDGPVKHLSQYFKFDNTDFLIAITNSKAYYYDTVGGSFIDITGAIALTGLTDDFVQSDTAFDIFVFTNNVDRVKKWTGTGNIADLGGLDQAVVTGGTVDVSAVKGITSFSGFMHVVAPIEDATRKPLRWRWSRFDNAEGWNNVGTYGQAGYADITDGPDKLQTSKRLGGDFLALYKERSIHIAQYVGPPTVWSRRLVVSGIGLIAPGAVTDIINEHIFIGQDNIYIFNGLSIKPVGDAIFDTFISELNPLTQHLIWAHTIYEENEVIFAYPSGGSTTPNRALVINYMTGAWAFRDMPFLTMGPFRRTTSTESWDSDPESWDSDLTRWDDSRFSENAPLHLGGDVNGYVHDYGVGFSQDGLTHSSYVVSPAIHLGRPERIKRFLRILVDLIQTGEHSLEVSYLTTNNPNATLVWSAFKNISCNLEGNPWVTIDVAGRYLFIRFRTNGTDRPWKLTSYGGEYLIRGFY